MVGVVGSSPIAPTNTEARHVFHPANPAGLFHAVQRSIADGAFAMNLSSASQDRAVRLRVDFVSDVTCPWCVIGLHALEQAMSRLQGVVEVDLQLQPFELNPDMPPQGEAIVDYVARKYGSTPEELAQRQEQIRARGAEVGFDFGTRDRVYNTFDAHRLLRWADAQGLALPLLHALFRAYHARGENPGGHEVLRRAAAEVGLDPAQADEVLRSGAQADQVRAEVTRWQQLGVHAVPSVVVEGRYLIQGGQPAQVFEQALRRIAEAPPAE